MLVCASRMSLWAKSRAAPLMVEPPSPHSLSPPVRAPVSAGTDLHKPKSRHLTSSGTRSPGVGSQGPGPKDSGTPLPLPTSTPRPSSPPLPESGHINFWTSMDDYSVFASLCRHPPPFFGLEMDRPGLSQRLHCTATVVTMLHTIACASSPFLMGLHRRPDLTPPDRSSPLDFDIGPHPRRTRLTGDSTGGAALGCIGRLPVIRSLRTELYRALSRFMATGRKPIACPSQPDICWPVSWGRSASDRRIEYSLEC